MDPWFWMGHYKDHGTVLCGGIESSFQVLIEGFCTYHRMALDINGKIYKNKFDNILIPKLCKTSHPLLS